MTIIYLLGLATASLLIVLWVEFVPSLPAGKAARYLRESDQPAEPQLPGWRKWLSWLDRPTARWAPDAAGATKDAEAWASFLEAQAKAAQTPEQRAVFDSHRLSAYMELKQPERALPMLQESERGLPDDYTPPARLAVAYFEMKKLDEALGASNRALPKVSSPRRVQVLQRRSDIFAARGDAAAAREALEQALAYAESLPPGQRSERQIQALKKRLETPPAKPTS